MAIEQKFAADISAVMAALAKLEQKQQAMENANKQGAARAKAASAEQTAQSNQASSVELANIKKREKMVEAATAASRKAQMTEAQTAYKFDQERLAHRQSVIARMTSMENEHAAKSAARFKGAGFKAFDSGKEIDAKLKEQADELKKQPGLIDMAGGAALRYLGPLALAATAVRLITNEWQNVIDRQQKAGQTALTFEEALGEATLNVGDVYGPDKLKAKALEMSAATGVSPATAVQTISLAIKSGGATTEAEAERYIPAAFAAAKLTPRASADELSKSAGSISDYMTRRNVSADQAAGVLLSMQSKSNIAKSNVAMDVFGPMAANMAAQGASDAMIQGLGPAITQALSDKTGEMTGTATVAFTQSLAEAGQSRFKGQKNIPDLMLAYLQQNKDEARDFFTGEMLDLDTGKKLGKPELGRGKAETPFRAIAGDPTLETNEANASFRKQYEDLARRAVSPDQAAKYYTDRLAQVQGATPTVQADRTLKSTADRLRLHGKDGIRGISREGLVDVLQSSGASDIAQKVGKATFDIGNQDALANVEGQLRGRANTLTQEPYEWSNPMLDQPGFEDRKKKAMDHQADYRERHSEQYRTAEMLREAADGLKEASRNFKARNRNGNVENVGGN